MTPARKTVSVVLVDDRPATRGNLRALLSTADGIRVVAEAAPGAETARAVTRHRPDVVLMDLRHPVAAARELLNSVPDAAVLVLTPCSDDESVLAAVRAGVRGYQLRSAAPEDIVRAVRDIANGAAIFGERAAHLLIEMISRPARREPLPELTGREREVLTLMTVGYGNAVIARRLHLSPKTVSNRVSAIVVKLRVPGRAEAIARAREAGLGAKV